ncbi:MAG: HNH endonuclease signature motif containing protein [Haliscomenobacter sp.]|uniref:HNH endonuclease n=1 Tax=Haliscomenobacter sp. TaxID=2717303 RepID=UPI0029B4B752|nr:HNH endonuclease signature motif containing protein [Haliscomenobacter sp.]MDX2070628.1 HNH endonuclease signature motif containing protein [Haliscomenobacter sp.]
MARIYITQTLRKKIIALAHNRCEYCQSMADYSNQPFVIEHIIPVVKGGQTIEENLAFACDGCNGHKYDKISGIDPFDKIEVPLFHPRTDHWNDHFEWNEDYTQILGKTSTGRATIVTLKLNRSGLINSRSVFVLVGLHPPSNQIS